MEVGRTEEKINYSACFLKKSTIIIFDKANGSLDNESEKAVQNALEQ
jgi:ABC-type multidrug transport system fused ATPase/permease subunit